MAKKNKYGQTFVKYMIGRRLKGRNYKELLKMVRKRQTTQQKNRQKI